MEVSYHINAIDLVDGISICIVHVSGYEFL